MSGLTAMLPGFRPQLYSSQTPRILTQPVAKTHLNIMCQVLLQYGEMNPFLLEKVALEEPDEKRRIAMNILLSLHFDDIDNKKLLLAIISTLTPEETLMLQKFQKVIRSMERGNDLRKCVIKGHKMLMLGYQGKLDKVECDLIYLEFFLYGMIIHAMEAKKQKERKVQMN